MWRNLGSCLRAQCWGLLVIANGNGDANSNLLGDTGHVLGTETLSPGPKRPSCVGVHRQHTGGLLHQSPGRLAHQILLWAQGKLLSLRAVHILGCLNHRADILGPGDGDSTPSSGESVPRRGPSPASSPLLAGMSMVSDLVCPGQLFMGDFRQEGSPFAERGHLPSHLPGVEEAVGVAPEGAQIIASGLLTEVVETILQSRALFTRKLYALKWNFHFLVWQPPA
ncbi:hypothetical protein M9458_043799, partial [Cirrhinus mrigala]